ncbi:beta-ketoacyl-ACP synthase II [bacterium]|nr:beta-ketoacyl-ACP synthase II [bacterium]MBU1985163.1 beta-ketoacyl-ACP synthase II [bacterium]
MKRRIVITGMGVVSPVGNDVPTFWQSLCSGTSGAGPITLFDPAGFATTFAHEVKNFDPSIAIEPKEARRMERFTQFGIIAAHEALKDAGLLDENRNSPAESVGVIVGSGIGGMQVFEEQCKVFFEKGPRRMSPFFVPMMIPDIVAGHISILFGLKGPNFAVVSACATAAHAIHVAGRLIQAGETDIMVTGGSEAPINHMGVGGFNALKAISTRNDEPHRASRPFDRDRDGFVLGEGAGIVVLEELEHARKRGATIHAELLGMGASGDAYHITAPHVDGEGAKRAMTAALKDAGLGVEQVDYINMHGTSTDVGDPAECKAIRRLFGDYADKLCVSSTKSMTAHCLGAAGAVEAIAAILATKRDVIPPTINLENQDPACDLYCVPNKAEQRTVNVAMSNSFGFGGHNSSLVVAKPGYRAM